MSPHAPSTSSGHHAEDSLPDKILRFRTSERHIHWAVAVPFMVCYVTAVILVTIYNPNPTRPYRAVFSWIHRLSGVNLFLLPLLTFLWHRRDLDIHLRNVLTVWRWRLHDVKWLFLMGPATLNKRIVLPDQDKFNAAEKINFMVLTVSTPLYIMTGFLIWLPGVAFLAWLVHLSLAAMATPLILGHIFMATVNPDTRIGLGGMISGFVDRRWAEHHYGHWYREYFGHLHRHALPGVGAVVKEAAAASLKSSLAPLAAGVGLPMGLLLRSSPAVVPALAFDGQDSDWKHVMAGEEDLPASARPPFLRSTGARRQGTGSV